MNWCRSAVKMCFDDVKVTERPQRFDGEPRMQRLAFVKEGNSSRSSDEWLATNPRTSGPVVVRQLQRPYHQEPYPLPQQHPQQFQQPRWQQPQPFNQQHQQQQLYQQQLHQQRLHQQQQQFRPQPQIVVPPPAPLPPPQHQGHFGQPIIHQGNPNGFVNVGGGNQHDDDGWQRGVRVIEAAPRPVRVIQDRPRARIPHRDPQGRRLVRTHSRRREQEYYDGEDDDDDDSFVQTVESYESDDSFDPRQRSRSRTRRTSKYYHR